MRQRSVLAATLTELRALPEVRLLSRATAFGYYDHNSSPLSSASPITCPSRRYPGFGKRCG